MSQPSITSYFNSRKRAATDDIFTSKSKVPHTERTYESSILSRKSSTKNELLPKKRKHLTSASTESNDGDVIKCEDVPEIVNKAKIDTPAASSEDKTVFTKKVNTSNIIKTVEVPKSEESTSLARKELSLGDIRKKLAGSSRLAELRANAERITKEIKQLQEATEKKNLKGFKSIDVEILASPNKKSALPKEFLSPEKQVPVSQDRLLISPRKVFVSPIKSPNKVPAYVKHAALACSSTQLPLPYQYRILSEVFRAMETVAALLFNRNEKITFAKLKPSVQEMLKRSFTEKHLSQIKYLVPDFYNFEVQKIKNFSNTSHKDAYELVITPNFPHNIQIMNPTVLIERRRYFNDSLLSLVKKHHSRYLLTLDPPMVIPDDKLSRWHPEFEIEKVPEVECSKFPEIPNKEKTSSAQDVLAKARELFKCNTKMERALEKLAAAKQRGLTNQEKTVIGEVQNEKDVNSNPMSPPSTSSVTLINPALRNLPASLLEKVKAKQAAKALEAMTRSPQHEQKYLIYSRLPDLARTLRNIFVTERKNVLALNIILSKLESSFNANVSANDLQRDIKVLTEQLPEWIKLHDIRNNSYLKLDKKADLNKITTKLETLAAKYKDN